MICHNAIMHKRWNDLCSSIVSGKYFAARKTHLSLLQLDCKKLIFWHHCFLMITFVLSGMYFSSNYHGFQRFGWEQMIFTSWMTVFVVLAMHLEVLDWKIQKWCLKMICQCLNMLSIHGVSIGVIKLKKTLVTAWQCSQILANPGCGDF